MDLFLYTVKTINVIEEQEVFYKSLQIIILLLHIACDDFLFILFD